MQLIIIIENAQIRYSRINILEKGKTGYAMKQCTPIDHSHDRMLDPWILTDLSCLVGASQLLDLFKLPSFPTTYG